ncbi:hypothetical protein RR46_06051 [Papilio xuthus]|uniref:Uncharacterized protein n=1 Tax=Papilio xuthus TaxID=66420 RepID=A0A194Q9T4_PAPXU|nr:hypothetical protein RR46_06051 [Papilio xuthus]
MSCPATVLLQLRNQSTLAFKRYGDTTASTTADGDGPHPAAPRRTTAGDASAINVVNAQAGGGTARAHRTAVGFLIHSHLLTIIIFSYRPFKLGEAFTAAYPVRARVSELDRRSVFSASERLSVYAIVK